MLSEIIGAEVIPGWFTSLDKSRRKLLLQHCALAFSNVLTIEELADLWHITVDDLDELTDSPRVQQAIRHHHVRLKMFGEVARFHAIKALNSFSEGALHDIFNDPDVSPNTVLSAAETARKISGVGDKKPEDKEGFGGSSFKLVINAYGPDQPPVLELEVGNGAAPELNHHAKDDNSSEAELF